MKVYIYICTLKYCSPPVGPSPPSDVIAVQDGLTSIRVTWTPPSPLGYTTGYRISYTEGGGSNDSVDVDGGNTNSHTLMGLTNGATYFISIVATASSGLSSTPVVAGSVALSELKCKECRLYVYNSLKGWEFLTPSL